MVLVLGFSLLVMTHPQLVELLVKSPYVIQSSLTVQDVSLIHMVLGVCGEAGELLDAVKKQVIYRKELDRENIIEELGDLEFYLEGMRQSLNLTREEILAANIAKLQKRYADGYSDKAAHERADKL